MKRRPPLNDAVAFALARLVDDAQTDRRDPSHSDLQFCVVTWTLTLGDPTSQGQTVGKAKRVRSVLTWAMEHSYENGCGFVDQLVSLVRTCGGFRGESPNYVGEEAIKGLRDAMASEGFVLTSDGDLRPVALDALSGTDLTDALASYVRRAQKGADDAALIVGTGKDLLESVAAHVLLECWNTSNPPQSFPPHLAKPSSRLISRLLPTFLSVANRRSIDCSVPSTRRPAPSTRCATNRVLGMVAYGYRQSLSKKPGM